MGLYYNPPSPHIGAAQPLEPRKLTPPSGPAPQNPPIIGSRHKAETSLRSWVALGVQNAAYPFMGTSQPLERRERIPPSGPAPQNPPIVGTRHKAEASRAFWLAAAVEAAAYPFMGTSQPLERRERIPPSGGAAQNPPWVGVPDEIYQAWYSAPPVFLSIVAPNDPLTFGQVDNPPFVGGASVPEAVLTWWIPPPPQPQTAILLDPAQSGPAPDNPPFDGGAQIPQAVLNWWLPAPPAPQTSILLDPPQSGPEFVFPSRGFPLAVLAWWSRAPVIVDLYLPAVPQEVPVAGPAGAYTGIEEVLVNWIPRPPSPITARLLNPPISGPTPNNPPFVGGAKVPQAVLQWWIPPAPPPQLPEPFTLSTQVAQNPSFVGARVPDAVLQWWATSAPLPQLQEFFVPAAAIEFPFQPVRVPVAIAQWWQPTSQLLQRLRLLTPPQSGPTPNNPPFVGGARVPYAVTKWWIESAPLPPPQFARNLMPPSGAPIVTVTVRVATRTWGGRSDESRNNLADGTRNNTPNDKRRN